MKLRITDEAEQDLVEGARFYDTQSPGLGQYFLDTLFADIESLRLHAGVHARHFGHHRLLSRRFPYAVFYKIGSDEAVEVRAILDCRRNPSRIGDRLRRDR
ncbi:MAG: type II toxin-antitoxin system RelE/ParE family toxin [Acidobacteriota bacterium]